MEENIQINSVIRWVGIVLCGLIVIVTVYSLFLPNKPPIVFYIGNIALLALFFPVCVLGYIPGKYMNKLPKFLVNVIKLDIKKL